MGPAFETSREWIEFYRWQEEQEAKAIAEAEARAEAEWWQKHTQDARPEKHDRRHAWNREFPIGDCWW